MSTLTYKESGVDPDKADHILESFSSFLKTRPRDPRLLSGIGPYASCFSLKGLVNQYEDPLLVTCCDGVGTKAKLALDWNQIDRLGEDLVAMNVNDLICVGGTPLLFLDYYACGKLSHTQLLTLLKSIQKACEMSECTLAGGETAEMPGMYQDQDFDLAGFSVGIVDRKYLLGETKVKSGEVLVAIASSGLHSNGYSLVRKVVEKENLKPQSTAAFGKATWSEVLLAPTTLYVAPLKKHLNLISGLAHITGGGLFGNLPRILPKGTRAVVEASKWPLPELYVWLQSRTQLNQRELLSTFNCGVGMIATCSPTYAPTLIQDLKNQGLSSWQIGVVEPTSNTNEPEVVWRD